MAFSFKARFRGRRAVAALSLCRHYALAPASLFLRSLETDLHRTYIGGTSDLYRTYTCFGTELWRKKSDNRPCPRPSVPVPNNFPSPCVI